MKKRRRKRVTVTIDPVLVDLVDEHVQLNPSTNRSNIFEKALELWRAEQETLEYKRYYESLSDEERQEDRVWSRRGG